VLHLLYLKPNVTLTLPGSNGSSLTWTLNLRKMIKMFDHCAIAARYKPNVTPFSPWFLLQGLALNPQLGKWGKCLTTVLPSLNSKPKVALTLLVPVAVAWLEPYMKQVFDHCATIAILEAKCYTYSPWFLLQ
jgi:hypothetical protein